MNDNGNVALPFPTPGTAVDLIREIASIVRRELPPFAAKRHMRAIRQALVDVTQFFGAASPNQISVGSLLTVAPIRMVQKIAPMASCVSAQERARGIRLLQQHACALGCHPLSGAHVRTYLRPIFSHYPPPIAQLLPTGLAVNVAAYLEWLRRRRWGTAED